MALLWELFVGFFKAGILGYGGGPSIIPLIEAEVVRGNWLTKDEFASVLAIGNTLPGPIATKMAACIGYKSAGWAGALSALLAVVAPTAIIMIVLYGALSQFKNNPVIAGIIRGVKPVVWALFLQLLVEYLPFVSKPTGALIGIGAAALILALRVHPAWVILMGATIGGVFLRTVK